MKSMKMIKYIIKIINIIFGPIIVFCFLFSFFQSLLLIYQPTFFIATVIHCSGVWIGYNYKKMIAMYNDDPAYCRLKIFYTTYFGFLTIATVWTLLSPFLFLNFFFAIYTGYVLTKTFVKY